MRDLPALVVGLTALIPVLLIAVFVTDKHCRILLTSLGLIVGVAFALGSFIKWLL